MERGKSLGGLIVWLVDQIATHGKTGVLQHEIVALIQNYYSQTAEDDLQPPDTETSQFWLRSSSPPTLDKPFFDYIWRVLNQHPELRIEDDDRPAEPTLVTEPKHDSAQADSSQAQSNDGGGTQAYGDRLVASEIQIWRSIAGHEPDSTRVPNLDFTCLSIIAMCGSKGIPQHDLIRISGQDKRSLPNRTDRLHKNGYIVKQPVDLTINKTLVHTSLMFLKRFAQSSEALVTQLTEEARSKSKCKKSQRRRLKAEKEALAAKGSQEKQDTSLEAANETIGADTSHDPSIVRPVAQWTQDRNIVNQVFDAVSRFGLDGATLNDILGFLMGSEYRRPIEELLSKLTSAWQVSQPLHLRHLAIVRDSVQRNRSQVYIYYTFDNYRRLVEAGKRSWEAIISLQDKALVSGKRTAHLDEQPALDEYGFPKLDSNNFEGLKNDGSLRECIPAEGSTSRSKAKHSFGRPPRTNASLFDKMATPVRSSASKNPENTAIAGKNDLEALGPRTPNGARASKQNGVVPTSESSGLPAIIETTPIESESLVEPEISTTDKRKLNLTGIKRGRGRPRKHDTAGLPANIESWNEEQIKNLIGTRRASDMNQISKLTASIDHRIEGGDDPHLAAHEVLKSTDLIRKDEGEEPVSRNIIMHILHKYTGAAEPPEDHVVASLRTLLENATSKAPHKKKPRVQKNPEVVSGLENGSPAISAEGTVLSGMQSVGKRKRRLPKAFDDTQTLPGAMLEKPRIRKSENLTPTTALHWQMPSVDAHFQLNHRDPTPDVQLPHTTSHKRTQSLDAPDDTEKPRKRTKVVSIDTQAVEATVMPLSQTQSPLDEVEDSPQSSTLSPKPAIGIVHHLMAENYNKTIKAMPRPSQGVFISKSLQRYKRRGDPAAVGTMRYQIAIFKLSALRDLEWFVTDTTVSGHEKSSSPRNQEQSNPSKVNDNLSRQDQNRKIDLQPISRSIAEVTVETEINASRQDPGASLSIPTALVSKDNFMLQSEVVVMSKQPAEPTLASKEIQLNSSFGESEENLPQALPEDSDASESVSVLSIVAPYSLSDPDRIQSVGEVSTIIPISNGSEAHKPTTIRTTQFPTDREQDPVDYSTKLSATRDIYQIEDSSRVPSTQPLDLARSQMVDLDTVVKPAQAAISFEAMHNVSHDDRLEAEEPSLNVNSSSPRKPRVGGADRSGQRGGSTAILRRHIVVDIVSRCGGVFPEVRAMRIPFENEWKARGQGGVPDRTTVDKAVNLCCEQGKLRRIVFSFKNCNGLTATATVFALPEIDVGDPRIAETQDMIKQRHPQKYVPDAVLPEDAHKQSAQEVKQQQALKKEAEKKALVDEAKAMASKSQDERGAYLTSLQASNRSEREKRALTRLAEPSGPGVERLVSISKPMKRMKPFPHPHTPAPPSGIDRSSTPLLTDRDPYDQYHVQNGLSGQRPRNLALKVVAVEENAIAISPQLQDDDLSHTQFDDGVDDSILTQPTASQMKSYLEDDDHVFPGFMDPVHIFHRVTGTFSTSFPGFRFGTLRSNHRGSRKYTRKALIPVGFSSPFPSTASKYSLSGFPGVMSSDTFHVPSGTFSATFFGFGSRRLQPIYPQRGRGRPPLDPHLRTTKRPRVMFAENVDENGLPIDEKPSPRKAKRRRKAPTSERKAFDDADDSPAPLIGTPVRLRRVRGPQMSGNMGEDGALRLFVAVTVVRVLTGGVRRLIDWALVALAFLPDYDETFIRHRWSAVLSKMRHHQVKMDADFQTLFARAYEEGSVPHIDFNNLGKYDWKWLVHWTMNHLDTPATSAPHLLADRSAFDSQYTLQDDSQEKDLAHYFEFEGPSVQELRNSVINRQAHTCPLFPKPSLDLTNTSKVTSYAEQVAVARSWIRANIITANERYDSQRARARLNFLPTHIVEAALESLLHDKLINERKKSRALSGRNYEFTDLFEKRLRTNMPPAQFHRAFAFKTQLDQVFESDGKVRWNELAHDGEAMAVLNLVAHQKINIVPVNLPLNMWGHTDDGYLTRKMDKARLNFEMDLVPTPKYVAGKPLEPLPPPPATHLKYAGGYPEKIPVWYDINDDFVPVMWKHTLAAILGLLAVRTGASAAELQVTVRPSLDVWEVEEVLQWMVKANVAENVGGNGYALKEWWWMALP